jgi:hypothetical protein
MTASLGFSQNTIEMVLSEIETNNTSLAALRKSLDAEQLENKTGIYLDNPEFEFHYLWGSPTELGNRTDFSIRQSFDFPTVYGYKNQISELKNEQLKLEYERQRRALLLDARITCTELTFANARLAELAKRLISAEQLASSYAQKFKTGESNVLEYNKAQLNFLNLNNTIAALEIEQKALSSELTRMNGGKAINFSDTVFRMAEIAEDFELWYLQAEEVNPSLSWLRQEIEISQRHTKLSKASSYPKLQAGYMSEKVVDAHFQGVTIGLSIPLFENKNTVKFAKIQTQALESIAVDEKLQFYNRLIILHTKAKQQQANVIEYRQKLEAYDNSTFLVKALEQGEISLIEYLLEISLFYDSIDTLLEMEAELNKTIGELNQYL